MVRLNSFGESLKARLEIYKDGDIDVETMMSLLEDMYHETVTAREELRRIEQHEQYMKVTKVQKKAVTEQTKMMKEALVFLKDLATKSEIKESEETNP